MENRFGPKDQKDEVISSQRTLSLDDRTPDRFYIDI